LFISGDEAGGESRRERAFAGLSFRQRPEGPYRDLKDRSYTPSRRSFPAGATFQVAIAPPVACWSNKGVRQGFLGVPGMAMNNLLGLHI